MHSETLTGVGVGCRTPVCRWTIPPDPMLHVGVDANLSHGWLYTIVVVEHRCDLFSWGTIVRLALDLWSFYLISCPRRREVSWIIIYEANAPADVQHPRG